MLIGPPGSGKSYAMRQEAINQPGLYLFVYPTVLLLEEQATAFEAESDVSVIRAHSEALGGGTVQSRLDRNRAHLTGKQIDHAVVMITHEGLMGADLTEFGDWHIRIDEAPTTLQGGTVTVPASTEMLRQMIAIDPVDLTGWGEMRLLGEKHGFRDLAKDALLSPLAGMLKQAGHRHGVFVDTVDWTGSFGWCSIWPFASLAHCRSVKVAGASFLISLGAVVAKRWEAESISFVPIHQPLKRTGQPTIRIHYFTRSHEGTTTLWQTRRGRRFIVNICDFLVAKEPHLGFWAANDAVEPLLDNRLHGKPISAKSAGLNQFDDETSCAFIYSSKRLPSDQAMQALFALSDEEILRAREEEDILQFVTRGAIRKPSYDCDYDIYLYSKRQAELVAEKLADGGFSKPIELIPEPDAGLMDIDPQPMRKIRAAIVAAKSTAKATDRKADDAARKRAARAKQAQAEGRQISANEGKGGRPKGVKDKTPRKPRSF